MARRQTSPDEFPTSGAVPVATRRAALAACMILASLRGADGHKNTVAGLFGSQQLTYVAGIENHYGYDGQWLLQDVPPANASSDSAGVKLFDSQTRVARPALFKLPCRDAPADLESIRPFITNSFRDAAFYKRRCGQRALTCGRVVLDGALDADVLEEAYEFSGDLQHWEGVEVVQRLLEKHFRTGPLAPTGGQLDRNVRSELPCEMHVDYLSRPPHYLLTAIIYLVDQGKDCGPCETVFNDAVESGELSRGFVVQPRRGRVVLFSGGMENMHCKMPSAGKRDVVQLWFACSGEPTAVKHSDF